MTLSSQIKAAAEKATQGEWKALGSEAKPCPIVTCDGKHGYQIHNMQRISRDEPEVWPHMKLTYQRDAEHIALCSPKNILSLIASHEAETARLVKLISEPPAKVIEPDIEKLLLGLETPTREDVANGTTVVYTPKPHVLWVCAAYRRLRALFASHEAREKELVEALKPFADEAADRPWLMENLKYEIGGSRITNDDLRRAAKAVKGEG